MTVGSYKKNGDYNPNVGIFQVTKKDIEMIKKEFFNAEDQWYCFRLPWLFDYDSSKEWFSWTFPENTEYDMESLSENKISNKFRINSETIKNKLRKDFVLTYAHSLKYAPEWKPCEKLICSIEKRTDTKGREYMELKKIKAPNKPTSPELLTIIDLLEQGNKVYNEETMQKHHPCWSIVDWQDFDKIKTHAQISDCVYCWYGFNKNNSNDKTLYVYIGIVGATADSKGILYNRIIHESKKDNWYDMNGKIIAVDIERFRYSKIADNANISKDVILHMVEMQEVTVLSSLFPCYNRYSALEKPAVSSHGTVICKNGKVREYSNIVLLNSQTSWNFI